MKVKCINNRPSEIEDSHILQYVSNRVHLEELNLKISNEYKVYGVIFEKGGISFYLCDEENDIYPKPYHSIFFEVINPEISDGWKLLVGDPTFLLPSVWADYPNFLEELLDGDLEVINLFQEIKNSEK